MPHFEDLRLTCWGEIIEEDWDSVKRNISFKMDFKHVDGPDLATPSTSALETTQTEPLIDDVSAFNLGLVWLVD